MSLVETLNCPPWMEKRCLERWLQNHYGDLTVTDCVVEAGSAVGDNYLSDIRRVRVKTKGGDTYSLIIKCSMTDGVTAGFMKDSIIFRKEKEMYGKTLPKIHALLQKAYPDNFERVAPNCVYACSSFLAMEDLKVAGFKMLERRVGLDLEQCLLVMRTLARYHAASVVLHQQDPDSMDKYRMSFFSDPAVADNWTGFFTGMPRTLAEELDSWTEEWKTYADKLRRMADCLLQRVQETCKPNATGFNVLLHGDLWTNNMMFRGHACSLRLYDFQLAQFTSPCIDLHYFIITSTSLDVKMNHRDTLLREYHRTLCDTLTTLDYERPLISMQELEDEFEKKYFYGLFALIGPGAVMQTVPESGFDFDDVLSTGKTPGPKMYGEKYKMEVKWLLSLLDSKGFFEDF